MRHPQPATPVHRDKKTATGIVNDTVKKHRSRSMEMRYFWVTDQVHRKILDIIWQPGAENLADYFSKHHIHFPDAMLHAAKSKATFLSSIHSKEQLFKWHPAMVLYIRSGKRGLNYEQES